MDDNGLGYDSLKRIAPHLIFCSISGYGPTGPLANRGGYDVVAAAIGGFLNITGPKDGEPVKAGIAVTDLMTAQYAHGAIMAALIHRQKTGKGQKIDCSLLATQIAALTNIGSGYLNTGKEPRKWGTDHETIVPYRGFETKDGKWLVVGAGNDRMWRQFCGVIGMPELIDQPDFLTNMERVKNRDTLVPILEERFLTKTLDEWSKLFEPTTMPFGPVNDMHGAFTNPQVVHSDLVKEVEHPTAGKVKMTGPPVMFSESENSVRLAPPLLGQHTREILTTALGLGVDEIARLRSSGVIDFPDSDPKVSSSF
jgi:succinate--hydroxymethylglutarate CoA-transferase